MSNNFCGNSDLIKFIVVEPIQSISGDTYVTGFTYSNSNLTIFQNQGQLPLSVNLPIYNGNSWYIPSGTTVTVTSGFQYFVYGDMYIDGTLDLQLDSQLVVLNGNLILSGAGTIIGAGTPYVISLPDIHISGVTYNNDILSITETNGNVFTVIIPTFSGNTSGSCITNLYVQNLNSCSPLHIQPINNGDVYISESGGNVGIGTINPSSTLDVNGKITTTNFQMTSGATNGYVLTSDASGNAYWSVPFSGSSVDTYVTGFTYNSSNFLTISQNQGQPDLTVTLPPYITGFTDTYVTGGTYSNGTLTLERQNGSVVVTGITNNNGGGGGSSGSLFYFNLSVPQSPYREISETPVTAIEQTSGVTIGGGLTSTIASFLTPSGSPNITNIPAGIWSFFLHSYKQNNNASFNIFCEVYVRTTGGTETLLISSDPEPITSNSPNSSMQVSDVFYSGTSLNSSDRILVKVRSTNTSNQSHDVTFVTEGTSHYSYLKTSFGGLSTITLQQAYNNSTSPEIVTNSTLNSVQFRGGTGSDTDKNITIENNSGVETAYITAGGDGVFNSLSATTISGGTYYGDGSNLTNIVTSITATSGLSGNSITGNVTIINTSPDQVVTLSGGTGVSVTGTYPNFTIINTSLQLQTNTINLFNYYNFI